MQFLTHYKKIIAWVLAVTMAFSSPMTSFAESEVMVKDSFGSMIDIIPKKAVSVEKDIPLGTEDAPQNSDVSTEVATESDTVFAEGEQDFIACSDPVDGIVVTVKAKAGVLPETAGIAVKKIESASTDSEDIEAAVDNTKIIDGTGDETGVQPAGAPAFTSELSTKRNILDITILDENGNEIEPDGEVEIKFTLTETVANLTGVRVFHAEDSAEKLTTIAEKIEEAEEGETESEGESELKDTPYVAEELEVIEPDDTAVPVEFSVITDSLSPFILEFTVADHNYIMRDVNQKIPLKNVLIEMGILEWGDGQIYEVITESVNPSDTKTLIDLSSGDGLWSITDDSKDAFVSAVLKIGVKHASGPTSHEITIRRRHSHAVIKPWFSSKLRYYDSLQEAIDAFGKDDEKITLIDDIILPESSNICIKDKDCIIKLDFDGHSITGRYAGPLIQVIGSESTGVEVEFSDSSESKTGKIVNNLYNADAFVIKTEGAFTKDRIRITDGYYEGFNTIFAAGADLSISGGEFHATGTDGYAMRAPGSDRLYVTIRNGNGIPKFDGVFDYVELRTHLQGGLFIDQVNTDYCDYGYRQFKNTDPSTFAKYPYAVDKLENAAAENTATGFYYKDLQSAFDDVMPGETLKILNDTTISDGTQVTVPDKKSRTQITVDLNGKTIKGNYNGELIKSLGTSIEFTDSSEGKAGSIINTEGSGTAYAIGFDGGNSGNTNNGIRISYGHYEGRNAVYFRYGFLQVYGGELVSAQAAGSGLAIQTDYSSNFAELTVANVNGIPKIKGGIYGIFSSGSASTGGIYSKPIGTGYDNIFASGYRRFRNEDTETAGEYPYAIGSSADAAAENTKTGLAYSMVKQAVEEAQDGDTVRLLADIMNLPATETANISKNITLDLNDHTYTQSGSGATGGPLAIVKGTASVSNGTMIGNIHLNGSAGDPIVLKYEHATLSNSEIYMRNEKAQNNSVIAFNECNVNNVTFDGISNGTVNMGPGYYCDIKIAEGAKLIFNFIKDNEDAQPLFDETSKDTLDDYCATHLPDRLIVFEKVEGSDWWKVRTGFTVVITDPQGEILSYYDSLQEAFNAVADGQIVILSADVQAGSEGLSLTRDSRIGVTLDLFGNEITGNCANQLLHTENINLTVIDSSDRKTGALKNTSTAASSYVLYGEGRAWIDIILKAGSYTGQNGIITKNGDIIFSDVSIEANRTVIENTENESEDIVIPSGKYKGKIVLNKDYNTLFAKVSGGLFTEKVDSDLFANNGTAYRLTRSDDPEYRYTVDKESNIVAENNSDTGDDGKGLAYRTLTQALAEAKAGNAVSLIKSTASTSPIVITTSVYLDMDEGVNLEADIKAEGEGTVVSIRSGLYKSVLSTDGKGSLVIRGGKFVNRPDNSFIAAGYAVFDNYDEATRALGYFYEVRPEESGEAYRVESGSTEKKYFASLSEAVNTAPSGSTVYVVKDSIVLSNDAGRGERISGVSGITINLNGKTLKIDTEHPVSLNKAGGNLTITNGTLSEVDENIKGDMFACHVGDYDLYLRDVDTTGYRILGEICGNNRLFIYGGNHKLHTFVHANTNGDGDKVEINGGTYNLDVWRHFGGATAAYYKIAIYGGSFNIGSWEDPEAEDQSINSATTIYGGSFNRSPDQKFITIGSSVCIIKNAAGSEYAFTVGDKSAAEAKVQAENCVYEKATDRGIYYKLTSDAIRDADKAETITLIKNAALEGEALAPGGVGTVILDLNEHILEVSGDGVLGSGAGTTLKIDNTASEPAGLINLIMDESVSAKDREVQFGQNFVFGGKLDLGAYAATISGGKWNITAMGENPNLRITGGKFSSNAWDSWFPQGYRFRDNQDDDKDIYPYYVGKVYTVTYEMNGHGAPQPASVSVSYGDKISEPQKPSAEGYVFDGWWTENGAAGSRGRQWNFAEDTVTADVTLYAKWDEAAAEVRTGDTWTSYPTVEEAFEKAVNGSTVRLFKDAVLSETQMINHQITLDLNGRTLSGKVDTYLLQINKQDFILKDSSANQTGKLENTGADDYEAGVYSYAIALMGDESSSAAYTFTMAGDKNSAYTVSGYNAIGAGDGYDVIRIRGGNVYSLGAKNDPYADAITWLDSKTVIDISGGYFTGNIDYAGTGSPESEPSVSGGYYSSNSVNSYMKTGYGLLRNTEEETKEAFPYKVALAYRVDFTAFTDSEYSYTTPVQYIVPGGKAVRPAPEPVKEGYNFKGWTKAKPDETTYVLWDFDDIVTEDMTLWGRWEQITHTVSFNMNGHGTPIEKIENIPYGATVSEPETPAAAGCEFDGWWTENGAEGDWGRQWNFKEDKVTSDVTLYAKWNEAAAKLTRDDQSGEAEVRYFAKLKDAVIAAEDGDTVALLKDVLTDETIVIKKNITLDLAGYELSGDLSGCVVKAEETSLTVKGLPAEVQSSSKRGSIVNNSTSAQSYAITLDGNVAEGLLTFTVDNAEIRGYNAILADISYDRLEMAAGRLTARGEAAEDGYTEGGGLIETTAGYAIAHWSSTMAIAISGGEVYGQIVYEGAGGLIESYAGCINGGKYNVRPGVEYLDPNYGVEITEDPVYIFCVVPIGQTVYTVTYDANGGKFGDGKDTKAVTVPYGRTIEQASRPDASYTGKVLNGWYEKLGDDYYSDKPWDFDKDVVTEDITLRAAWSDALAEVSYTDENEEQKTKQYADLYKALLRAQEVATGRNAVFKLLVNVDMSGDPEGKNYSVININNAGEKKAELTFDLNGKEITGNVSGALIRSVGDGHLIIKDSTETAGRIKNASGAAVNAAAGSVTIDSGKYNGGITGADGTIDLRGGEYDRKADITPAAGFTWVNRTSDRDYPYAVVKAEDVAAAYTWKEGEAEKTESFTSLDDAVVFANTKKAGTLKLVKDYTKKEGTTAFCFYNDVTIDLNNKTITGQNQGGAIVIAEGNLTVNTAKESTGGIINTADVQGSPAAAVSMRDYTKKLSIVSGGFKGDIVYDSVPAGQKPNGNITGGKYTVDLSKKEGYLNEAYKVVQKTAEYAYEVQLKTFTVNFVMNGHGTQIPSQTVIYKEKAVFATAYDAAYAFEGWFTKNGTTEKKPGTEEPDWGVMWNFDTPITDLLPEVDKQNNTVTLYAKWSDATVHVEAGAVQWNFSSIYDAAAAIKDAGIRNTGILLKLLKDCPLNRSLYLEYDPTDTLTVDLNGKSLSGSIAGNSMIMAEGGGNLIITDSDAGRNGLLQNTGFSGSAVLAHKSNVVISGGKIKGLLKADEGKTVELAGGIYDSTAYGSVTGSVRLAADKVWLTRTEDSIFQYEVISKSDLAATYTLGTKTYTFNSLQTAASYVNAHGGGTLKLEKNYISSDGQDTPGVTVTFTSDVTLDLNGQEIRVKNDNAPAVKSDARITIKDSSTAQNGTVANNGSGPAVEVKFRSSDSRDLIISGGRFGGAVRYYDVPEGKPAAPVTLKADIYGGAFSVDPTSPATYGRDASTINLSGILRAGYRVSASGSTPYIYIISNRYKVTLNIGTGGKFTDAGENPPSEKVEYYTYNSLIRQPGTESLNPGTATLDGWFTESGKRWNFGADRVTSDMKLTARWGNIVAVNGDKKYADLRFAINEAANGDTVKITQDVALNGRLSINNKNSLTIDLDGYTLSNTSDASGTAKGLVVVSGCSQLAVTGGSIKNSAGVGMNITGGEITITGTNVTGTTGITVNHNQAITLNINNSTIRGESLDGINSWSKQGIQNLQSLGASNSAAGHFNIKESTIYGKGDAINGKGFKELNCDLTNTSCTGENGCGVDTSGAGKSKVNVNGGSLNGAVAPCAAGAGVALAASGAALLGGALGGAFGGGFAITPIIIGCTIGVALLTGTLFALIFGSGDKGNQGKERYVDVEYDTNGGKPKIDPIKVLPGTQITIAGSKSTEKEGATLQKWSCSVDGKKYNPGSSYTVNVKTIFTAEYNYKITFSTEPAAISPLSQIVYEGTFATPPLLRKHDDNYVQKGESSGSPTWYEITSPLTSFDFIKPVHEHHDLVAGWEVRAQTYDAKSEIEEWYTLNEAVERANNWDKQVNEAVVVQLEDDFVTSLGKASNIRYYTYKFLKDTTLFLNDQSITENYFDVITVDSGAALKVLGGSKTGAIDSKKTAINVKDGSVTLMDNTYLTGEQVITIEGRGEVHISGATVEAKRVVKEHTPYALYVKNKDCKISGEITSGTISGKTNIGIADHSGFVLKGGLYTREAKESFVENNVALAPGMVWARAAGSDDMWTVEQFKEVARNKKKNKVYNSLQDALDDADSGDEIELLRDTKENIVSTDVKAADVKIDLGKHSVTGTFNNSFKADICNGSMIAAAGNAVVAAAEMIFERTPAVTVTGGVIANGGNAKITVAAEGTQINGAVTAKDGAKIIVTEDAKKAGIKGHLAAESNGSIELKAGLYTENVNSFCAEGYACLTNTDETTRTTYPYKVVPARKVQFDPDGGTPQPAAQTVEVGQPVSDPGAVTKESLTFYGWFVKKNDGSLGEKWNFAKRTVKADDPNPIVLKANLGDFTAYVEFISAEGVPVERYHTALKDAFAEAASAELPQTVKVVLLKDVTIETGNEISINTVKNYVFDLNGHRIQVNNPADPAISVSGKDLTLKIEHPDFGNEGDLFRIGNGAALTVGEGSGIRGRSYDENNLRIAVDGGSLRLEKGKYEKLTVNQNSGSLEFADGTYENLTVNQTNGSIVFKNGNYNFLTVMQGDGSVIFEDGNYHIVTAKKWNTAGTNRVLNVADGTFDNLWIELFGEVTIQQGRIKDLNIYPSGSKLHVNGGVYDNDSHNRLTEKAGNVILNPEKPEWVENKDVSTKAEYPWTLGIAPVAKNTTAGTEYDSLQKALDEAASGNEIKLLKDTKENIVSTDVKAADLKLDLGSRCITGTFANSFKIDMCNGSINGGGAQGAALTASADVTLQTAPGVEIISNVKAVNGAKISVTAEDTRIRGTLATASDAEHQGAASAIELKAGYYTQDVSAFCAENYVCKERTAEDKQEKYPEYGYQVVYGGYEAENVTKNIRYERLEQALLDGEEGNEIRLLKDIHNDKDYVNSVNDKLNLNGRVLECSTITFLAGAIIDKSKDHPYGGSGMIKTPGLLGTDSDGTHIQLNDDGADYVTDTLRKGWMPLYDEEEKGYRVWHYLTGYTKTSYGCKGRKLGLKFRIQFDDSKAYSYLAKGNSGLSYLTKLEWSPCAQKYTGDSYHNFKFNTDGLIREYGRSYMDAPGSYFDLVVYYTNYETELKGKRIYLNGRAESSILTLPDNLGWVSKSVDIP